MYHLFCIFLFIVGGHVCPVSIAASEESGWLYVYHQSLTDPQLKEWTPADFCKYMECFCFRLSGVLSTSASMCMQAKEVQVWVVVCLRVYCRLLVSVHLCQCVGFQVVLMRERLYEHAAALVLRAQASFSNNSVRVCKWTPCQLLSDGLFTQITMNAWIQFHTIFASWSFDYPPVERSRLG